MIGILPSLDWAYVTMILIWSVYYIARLLDHSKNEVFLKMPWFLLWFNAYIFGLCYCINNYSVQAHLETNLFLYTQFPVVVIIKLSLFTSVYLIFFGTLRFYSKYQNVWCTELLLVVSHIINCGIVVVLSTFSLAYQVIYWSSNLLVCWNASIALFLLIPIIRQFKRDDFPTVENIHLVWFVVCVGFAAIGQAFNILSAFNGLLSNRTDVNDTLQLLAYVANTFSLIAMMILTSPDLLIYWTALPIRHRQLNHLDQLHQYILNSSTIEEKYPLSDFHRLKDIERAIYERVVSIFDLYPYLDPQSDLYRTLYEIEHQSDSYHECMESLTRVQIP